VAFIESMGSDTLNLVNDMKKVSVLFVCMGNICRSPTAQGVFRALVESEALGDRIATDSAGTIAYHVGEPPDRRARETATKRGIDLSDLRARKVVSEDFDRFDYLLAMDSDNYKELREICPPGFEGRLHMFMDFAAQRAEQEVPDPYYGGVAGFDRVFDMVEEASHGLLDHILKQYGDRIKP
jgi:protein-tyrosine phosphatase